MSGLPVGAPVPSLANDPARYKSRYMGAQPVNFERYADQTMAFNRNLYAPSDTKPRYPQSQPAQYQPASSALDIAARYGNRNALTDTYANASRFGTNPATPFSFPAPPSRDSFYRNGNTGPQPVPMPIRYFRGNVPEDQTIGGFGNASGQSSPSNEFLTPEGLARQKESQWFAEGGSQRTLNRARVAAGIRPRIDARAMPSPQNSTASQSIRQNWGWNRTGSMDLPY